MAKRRKRVNKRVVVVLVSLGVVVVLGAVIMLFRRIPQDPGPFVAAAEKAMADANQAEANHRSMEAANLLDKALRNYGDAFRADKKPEYLYKQALIHRQLALGQYNLNRTQLQQHFNQVFALLNEALRMKDDGYFARCREALVDHFWLALEITWDPRGQVTTERKVSVLQQFLDQVDNYLRYYPEDTKWIFRRAIARARMSTIEVREPHWRSDANEDFMKAIALAPDTPVYRIGRIEFLRQSGADQPEIIKAFEHALTADPNSFDLREQYAVYLRTIPDNERALAQIRNGIRLAPHDVRGPLLLAQYHIGNRDFDLATNALEQARGIDPFDYRSYQMGSVIYRAMNRLDDAISELRTGLDTVQKKMASSTNDADRRQYNLARVDLSYALASALLDQALRTQDGKRRKEMVTEATDCLEILRSLTPTAPQRWKLEGQLAYVQGDLQKAAAQLEQACQNWGRMDREAMAAENLLISCYMRLGQTAKAEKRLEALMTNSVQQRNPGALVLLAKFRLDARDYREAKGLAEQALNLSPGYPEAEELLAVLGPLLGDKYTLPDNISISPSYVRLLVNQCDQLWESQRQSAAIQLLENLRKVDPDNREITLKLAQFYQSSKDPQSAGMLRESVAESDPNLAMELDRIEALAKEPDPTKRKQMQLGWAEERIPDPLRKALAKAIICRQYDDLEGSLNFLRQAEQLEPDSRDVIQQLFRHGLSTGNREMAEKYAAKAAELDLDGAGGRMYRAQLLVANRQFDEAITLLEEIIRTQPENKAALSLLGNCYLATKQTVKAEQKYRTVLELDRGYLDAVMGMAQVSRILGRPDDYYTYAEKAYELARNRNNPMVLALYLDAMEDRLSHGKLSNAQLLDLINLRRRRLTEEPADLYNATRLGWLFNRVNDFEQAEKLYRYVYDKAPPASKVDAARPLLDVLARTGKRSDVMSLYADLEKVAADKVALKLLFAENLAKSDLDSATAAYQAAVEANPKDPRARLAYGMHLAKLEKFTPAIEEVRQYLQLSNEQPGAQKTDPETDPLLLRYEVLSGDGNMIAVARRNLDKRLRADPLDVRALTIRAILQANEGQYEQALEALNTAIREAPTDPDPRLVRAQIYRQQNEMGLAKTELQSLWRISDDPQVGKQYAQMCLILKNYDEAEIVYRDLLQRFGTDRTALRGLMNVYSQRGRWTQVRGLLQQTEDEFSRESWYWQTVGQMWSQLRDVDKAVEAYRKGLDLGGAGMLDLARQYFQTLLDAGRNDDVRAAARELRTREGLEVLCDIYDARALVALNRRPEADAEFIRAFKVMGDELFDFSAAQLRDAYGPRESLQKFEQWTRGPLAGDWRPMLLLGHLQFLDGKSAQAAATFTKALDLAKEPSQKAAINLRLGPMLQQSGQFAEAEKAYLYAVEHIKSPAAYSALNNLAYLYAQDLQRPADALPYAKRALALRADDPAVLDTYGWTLVLLERYNDALESLRRAVERDSVAVYHYHLGYAYEKAKQPKLAAASYQDALRAPGRTPKLEDEIRQALERVSAEGTTEGDTP